MVLSGPRLRFNFSQTQESEWSARHCNALDNTSPHAGLQLVRRHKKLSAETRGSSVTSRIAFLCMCEINFSHRRVSVSQEVHQMATAANYWRTSGGIRRVRVHRDTVCTPPFALKADDEDTANFSSPCALQVVSQNEMGNVRFEKCCHPAPDHRVDACVDAIMAYIYTSLAHAHRSQLGSPPVSIVRNYSLFIARCGVTSEPRDLHRSLSAWMGWIISTFPHATVFTCRYRFTSSSSVRPSASYRGCYWKISFVMS